MRQNLKKPAALFLCFSSFAAHALASESEAQTRRRLLNALKGLELPPISPYGQPPSLPLRRQYEIEESSSVESD